jgi:hypothetical protein
VYPITCGASQCAIGTLQEGAIGTLQEGAIGTLQEGAIDAPQEGVGPQASAEEQVILMEYDSGQAECIKDKVG